MVRYVLNGAFFLLLLAALVCLASGCGDDEPAGQTPADTAAADAVADTPAPDVPVTVDQAAEVTQDITPEVTADMVVDSPVVTDAVDSPADSVADTNPVTDATDAIDVVTVCGAIGDPISGHTPFYNASDTSPSAHSFVGSCIAGEAAEHLYHIDLSGAGGNSDLAAFVDCQVSFDCALYLFSGPADACAITAGDVSAGDTICVDVNGGVTHSWERLEAHDLAPGHYWLAVDGDDGSDGSYDLWIKVSDHTDSDCRLHYEADITADFTIEDQNNGTGFDGLRLPCDGGETDGSPEHIYPIELADAGSITFDLTCASITDAYDCVVGVGWGIAGCDLEQDDMDLQFLGCFDDTTVLGDEEGCLNAVGGRYYLIVDGQDGAMGGYDLEIDIGATITDEPCLLENLPETCDLRVNLEPITDDIIIVDTTADDADAWFLPNTDNCDTPEQGAGTGDAVWELSVATATEVEVSIDCPLGDDCALVLIAAHPSGVCDLADLNGAIACEDGVSDESFTEMLAAGSYYVIVTSEDADAVLEYELEIDFNP